MGDLKNPNDQCCRSSQRESTTKKVPSPNIANVHMYNTSMSQLENTRKQSLIARPDGSGGTETRGLNLLRRLTT